MPLEGASRDRPPPPHNPRDATGRPPGFAVTTSPARSATGARFIRSLLRRSVLRAGSALVSATAFTLARASPPTAPVTTLPPTYQNGCQPGNAPLPHHIL